MSGWAPWAAAGAGVAWWCWCCTAASCSGSTAWLTSCGCKEPPAAGGEEDVQVYVSQLRKALGAV